MVRVYLIIVYFIEKKENIKTPDIYQMNKMCIFICKTENQEEKEKMKNKWLQN